MDGKELLKQLDEQRRGSHHFIKWWRRENDFVDIELLDSFAETVKAGDQFEGFDLLDMEQLWELVKKQCGDRVERTQHAGSEIIKWERQDKQGTKRTISCTFAPEFLLQIFDVETRGNYIESA